MLSFGLLVQVETPVNWVYGDPVFASSAVSDAEVARRFPSAAVSLRDMCGVRWRCVTSMSDVEEHPFLVRAPP